MVTVDMLSTGVDIPDLEFIVFLRRVRSRILFEQMLGRGTRKSEHLPDKSHFTVFDCFDGTLLEYFRKTTGMTTEPPERPARTIREIIEAIWANYDRAYNVRCLVRRLQRIDKEMAGEARELFASHGIPDGDVGRYASQLPTRLAADFAGEMRRLRDEAFQGLLDNYPRRKKVFVRATNYEDEVASEYLIRGSDGQEYKPEDYLEAFARFVRENQAEIDAIAILLDRPKDWSTDTLEELQNRLTAAPQGFTVDTLQNAHQVCYHKSLVDVISMVKHAAREAEPLLTAAERVDRAFQQLTAGREFTTEQQQWLDRIREHLIRNLSVGQADFDLLPVFNRHGGWGVANRVFDGNLSELIQRINEAIAA